MVYRRTAQPSGQAWSSAHQSALFALERAKEELASATALLKQTEADAAALRRAHDEAVHAAEQARARSLRFAIATAKPASVPPGLRESLDREQRERTLARALEGRGVDRTPPAKFIPLEQASLALREARTERSRVLMEQVRSLTQQRAEVAHRTEAVRLAEADLLRLAESTGP